MKILKKLVLILSNFMPVIDSNNKEFVSIKISKSVIKFNKNQLFLLKY